MAHIGWKSVSDELIRVDWGTTHTDVDSFIKGANDQRISMCLLLDIAKSLRILRCTNFTNIPHRLVAIREEITELRRDVKRRRAQKRRKF